MSNIKKILILTIFSLIMISGYSVVNAASAGISSNKTSISTGETANITISVNAAAWNLHVSGPISKVMQMLLMMVKILERVFL